MATAVVVRFNVVFRGRRFLVARCVYVSRIPHRCTVQKVRSDQRALGTESSFFPRRQPPSRLLREVTDSRGNREARVITVEGIASGRSGAFCGGSGPAKVSSHGGIPCRRGAILVTRINTMSLVALLSLVTGKYAKVCSSVSWQKTVNTNHFIKHIAMEVVATTYI